MCQWPPSATVVSVEPFLHRTGTLRCLQKEMATYRHWSVSLWRDPYYVSRFLILSHDGTEWRLISATLCGWRRCFVADQLWLVKRIQEAEVTNRTRSAKHAILAAVCWHSLGVWCYSCSGWLKMLFASYSAFKTFHNNCCSLTDKQMQ